MKKEGSRRKQERSSDTCERKKDWIGGVSDYSEVIRQVWPG